MGILAFVWLQSFSSLMVANMQVGDVERSTTYGWSHASVYWRSRRRNDMHTVQHPLKSGKISPSVQPSQAEDGDTIVGAAPNCKMEATQRYKWAIETHWVHQNVKHGQRRGKLSSC